MNRIEVSRPYRDKNILTLSERIGEIVGIAFITLIAAYFAYLQAANTGFMTSKFGFEEEVLFYGSFAIAIVASGARSIIGRRDRARPFEIVSNVFTAFAALFFLRVFPFDFAHIADPFPSFTQVIFSWNPNIFGWAVILLIAVATIVATVYNAVRLFLDWL